MEERCSSFFEIMSVSVVIFSKGAVVLKEIGDFAMTNKERLMATLCGKPVDKSPVNFYEINGFDENPSDSDPFNIYSHPSWLPLIELTREKTDRIVMRSINNTRRESVELRELKTTISHITKQGVRHTMTEIRAGDRLLKAQTKRYPDINTTWTVEHLLKSPDDLKAWLTLPDHEEISTLDYREFDYITEGLGDTGILMIDVADALCQVAALFSMEEYTIVALTEQKLFHQALEKVQRGLLKHVEKVAKEYPGRLWRIVGPEYASPPYLPPYLYEEYVVKYDKPLVEAIQKHGGFARMHQHGNQRDILDMTMKTGCVALDPIEPPPQGDVSLAYVRERYGDQMVLFGNLEVSDIELLDSEAFGKKVWTALKEGTAGMGRGFVLMPSASPYGRVLSDRTLRNYYKMIEVYESFFS